MSTSSLLLAAGPTVPGLPGCLCVFRDSEAVPKWNLTTRAQVLTLTLSSARQLVGVCLADGSALVLDVTSGELVKELLPVPSESSQAYATTITFDPANALVAVAVACPTLGPYVQFWQLETWQQSGIYSHAHTNTITQVSFSRYGPWLLATASEDATIWVYACESAIPRRLSGHEARVNAVAFSPDRVHLISGSDDGTVGIFNISTSEQVARLAHHKAPVTCVDWSSRGIYFATGGLDETVRLFRAEDLNVIWEARMFRIIRSLHFSLSGTTLLCGADEPAITVWCLTNNKKRECSTANVLLATHTLATSPSYDYHSGLEELLDLGALSL